MMQTVVVAKALVLDEHNNCLVLRRSKTHPDSALKPDLPGGLIDDDESPQAAVCREIAEETGLRVDLDDVQVVFATTDASRGKNVVRILHIARVSGEKPVVTISWEHDSFTWVPLVDLLHHIEHPEYRKGIEHILRYQLAA